MDRHALRAFAQPQQFRLADLADFDARHRDRALRLANERASYEKQQRRAGEIEDFVRRFRYKASKAKQEQYAETKKKKKSKKLHLPKKKPAVKI